MNKEWSAKNKEFQQKIKKEITYKEGIQKLLELREEFFKVVEDVLSQHTKEELCAMPCPNANGYHNKTIAYSLWHIFRIEDIVCNTLIQSKEQVLFKGYLEQIHAPIITTGNELVKEEIVEFSKELNIDALFRYGKEVKKETDTFLQNVEYSTLKQKVEDRKEDLLMSQSVSEKEGAFWLVDYWCHKDIKGLIQMPFSRHWIMHIEAILRIQERLK